MKLLTDTDLRKELTKPNPIIENVPSSPDGWAGPKSAIQPSSLDLHIGEIFIPEVKKGKPGSEESPLDEHMLKAGHTAVVGTAEKCALPNDIAGIGFPPDTVSSKGILMTNPGHIDPGYKGNLRFTLINMGRKPYSMRVGDPIVTILLFQLDNAVHQGYGDRHPGMVFGTSGVHNTLQSLSADFVSVEMRARKIAIRQIRKSGIWATVGPGVVSFLIAAVIAYFGTTLSQDRLQELKKDIAVLQSKPDTNELKRDVGVLQYNVTAEWTKQINGLQGQIAELRRQIEASKQPSRETR